MATLQPSDFRLLAQEDRHSSVLTTSVASYRNSEATENHVHRIAQPRRGAAASPNHSTFYKTYLDPNNQLLGDQDYSEPDDGGYTSRSGVAAVHGAFVNNAQPQAGSHAAAYKLATRLEDRSNGGPLATIIEQGSYSTLNSHGSLLSVGRLPSTKAVEAFSPTRGARRRSRSLDENALQDIQEDLAPECDTFAVAVPVARPSEENEPSDPASDTATPYTSCRFETQQSPSCHSGNRVSDQDDRKVKGFIRGVLQNMRGVSRGRSRSPSSILAPTVEHWESPQSTIESRTDFDLHGQLTGLVLPPNGTRRSSNHSSANAATQPAMKDQTRSQDTQSSSIEPSGRTSPPAPSRSNATKSGTNSGFLPPEFHHQNSTCSHERPCSTSIVQAGTRDPAKQDCTASALHHDMFDTSAGYTFDGIPIYRGHLSSSRETASARNLYTSQNASFCSTMSTSYSGTVLGIDLDLQHDFSLPIRRSQSPPTPVWFTPQMAELQRQASLSESPSSVKTKASCHAQSRSITSSALTSLLPIAVASGVVRPNYNTPTISFYSPSGNLIQPESSSPRTPSLSQYRSPPPTKTSYYNRQNADPVAAAGFHSTRPPLIPMTTPPTRRRPLPLHLRHHHNRYQPEMSQINSRITNVTPEAPIKGCDGVVRENSLSPRTGVFFPDGKDRAHRSAKLIMHDWKTKVRFYKTRFRASAAAQSFVPSMSKGKPLQKRCVYDYDTYAAKYYLENTESGDFGFKADALGAIAAHALRACFCQPYDGAGSPTRDTTIRSCITSEPIRRNGELKEDQCAKDAELLLPNTRIVGSRTHSKCGDTTRAIMRDSAFQSTTQRASMVGKAKLKSD